MITEQRDDTWELVWTLDAGAARENNPIDFVMWKDKGLLSSRAQQCKAHFIRGLFVSYTGTHLPGLLKGQNIMIPLVLDLLAKIYEGHGWIFSNSADTTQLSITYMLRILTPFSASSRCEFPIHCEKQLHYLLIKSLPFLHSSQLSVITALNKRLWTLF